jgi:hypothetical protein
LKATKAYLNICKIFLEAGKIELGTAQPQLLFLLFSLKMENVYFKEKNRP